MTKVYDDLTFSEQDDLSNAWLDIYKGLEVYAKHTGVSVDELADCANEAIHDYLEFRKGERSD